jgi:hypothetical protein
MSRRVGTVLALIGGAMIFCAVLLIIAAFGEACADQGYLFDHGESVKALASIGITVGTIMLLTGRRLRRSRQEDDNE